MKSKKSLKLQTIFENFPCSTILMSLITILHGDYANNRKYKFFGVAIINLILNI